MKLTIKYDFKDINSLNVEFEPETDEEVNKTPLGILALVVKE